MFESVARRSARPEWTEGGLTIKQLSSFWAPSLSLSLSILPFDRRGTTRRRGKVSEGERAANSRCKRVKTRGGGERAAGWRGSNEDRKKKVKERGGTVS